MKFLTLLLLLVTSLAYGQLRPGQAQYYQERGALLNPSFENGLENWTLSGGCTASVTSDVPLLAKTLQVTCVAQTLSLKQEVAALADFVGQQGVVDVQIKTDVDAIKVSALVNGFQNAPVTVNSSAGYQRVTNLPFVMGDTSSGIEIYSLTPITGTIYIDNVYVGFSPDGLIQTDYDDTPIGAVLAHSSETVPDGYMLADGRCLDKNEYNALFQIISTAHGTCDAGGGASSGFRIPDLLGKFVRGWQDFATNDPDAGSRTACKTGGATGNNVGSCQGDAFQGHEHEIYAQTQLVGYGDTYTVRSASGFVATAGSPTSGHISEAPDGTDLFSGYSSDGYGTPRVSTESRPVNVYLAYIIKVSGRLPENLYVKKSLSPDKAGFITWAAFSGSVEGHLVADGSCVDVNAWPDYVDNVGSLYGDCDAGSGPLSGVRLPNITGSNRYIRAAGGSLAVGTEQDDATAVNNLDITANSGTHKHDFLFRRVSDVGVGLPPYQYLGSSGSNVLEVRTAADRTVVNSVSATQSGHDHPLTGDTETRPISIAMTPYIRMVDRDTVVARLKNGARVGDCKWSLLDHADFNSQNSGNWLRLEGQSVAGTDIDTKFGISTLPNGTGNNRFLRMADGTTITERTLQDDATAANGLSANQSGHYHTGGYAGTIITGRWGSENTGVNAPGRYEFSDGPAAITAIGAKTSTVDPAISVSGDTETRPYALALNFYCMVSE